MKVVYGNDLPRFFIERTVNDPVWKTADQLAPTTVFDLPPKIRPVSEVTFGSLKFLVKICRQSFFTGMVVAHGLKEVFTRIKKVNQAH